VNVLDKEVYEEIAAWASEGMELVKKYDLSLDDL
jgi:hypothetical protein